jgi:hypothetical protein
VSVSFRVGQSQLIKTMLRSQHFDFSCWWELKP